MEKYAWRGKIVEGKVDEYIKRHNEIWPEMLAELEKASIRNYSIWRSGNDLFGYYECDSVEFAQKVQASSPIVDKWNIYMKDVLIMDMDEKTGAQPLMTQVFSFK